MNATNQIRSPITPSARTTLALRLVNHSCQTPSSFNYLRARATTSMVTETNSVVPTWAYGVMFALLIVGLAIGYVVRRPPSKP